MNMLTETVVAWGRIDDLADNINEKISEYEDDGWELRGVPQVLDTTHVLLTFEKPKEN